MQIITYYIKANKTWWAYMQDVDGDQIGNAEYAPTKELAAFWLGVQYANLRSKQYEKQNEL
jgi:hypothetical protein